MEIEYLRIAGTLALCYLLGSIPSAYLLGRVYFKLDIREYGSGNMGTMNTRLIMGWIPALAVFLIDCSKGALAAWLAGYWGSDALLGVAAAVTGHIWPVWLRFSGGKGLATTLGGLIWTMQPAAIAVFVIAWVLTYALWRLGDPASVAGGIAMAVYALNMGPLLWLAVTGMIIAGKHYLSFRSCTVNTTPSGPTS